MNYSKHTVLPVALIGEEIGIELGSKMITSFVANKSAQELTSFIIGRDIIQNILNQPGCSGIKFLKAVNEFGEHTYVYLGVDNNCEQMFKITSVDNSGGINVRPGIVADRIFPTTKSDEEACQIPSEWEWTID